MPNQTIQQFVCGQRPDRYADNAMNHFLSDASPKLQNTIQCYNTPEQSGNDTPYHAEMTSRLMALLVDEYNAKHPDAQVDKECFVVAARLHDIGKTSESLRGILNKNEKLSDAEFAEIKTHTVIGHNIIQGILNQEPLTPFQKTVLQTAQEMARCHHERVDGRGYPYGLTSEQIPVSAKMMAVVDVLEALTAQRTYKEQMPLEQATAILQEGAGTQFDKEMVALFLSNHRLQSEIAQIIEQGREEKVQQKFQTHKQTPKRTSNNMEER